MTLYIHQTMSHNTDTVHNLLIEERSLKVYYDRRTIIKSLNVLNVT